MSNVVERYSSGITLSESDSVWVLKGSYNAMQSIIPLLKTQKVWKYNGFSQSWEATKAKISNVKLNDVKAALSGAEVTSKENFSRFEEKARTLTLPQTTITIKTEAIFIKTTLIDLKDLAKAAGVTESAYAFYGYMFTPGKINVEKSLKLLGELEKAAALYMTKIDELEKLVKNQTQGTGIRVSVTAGIVYVMGETYPHKDKICKCGFGFSSGQWQAHVINVNLSSLRTFLAELPKKEVKDTPAPSKSGRQSNSKSGKCTVCGFTVEVGDGYISQIFDDDEERHLWVVRHKDPNVCESNKVTLRTRAEAAKKRSDAQRRLRSLLVKPEYYVEGRNLQPEGQQISLDHNPLALGGGCRLIVEPDLVHVWYVQSNGNDGDDWSHNNIGFTDIGWRSSLTTEVEALIEELTGIKVR